MTVKIYRALLTGIFLPLSLIAFVPAATAQVIQVLHSFQGFPADGDTPFAGLVQGGDGNFYGTTAHGGAYTNLNGDGYGTAFVITPGGAEAPLVSFTGTQNSLYTSAGLTIGSDGNFYGATYYGGANDAGTVFQMTPGGALTPLASFNYDNGALPNAALVQGADGSFYGTTVNGGDRLLNYGSGLGSVYKITTGGTLTTLAVFHGPDGANPYGGLVQGPDGVLYGTTGNGGANGSGTVFSLTTNGVLATLVSFNGANGATPRAKLAWGADGNLYGTTSAGGNNNNGTVFKVTTAGVLSPLVIFNGLNGANPYAGLVLGTDGVFYGTTLNGGTNTYYGVVFQMTPDGTLTVLASLSPATGGNPFGGLVQGTDGNFYGTASGGGTQGHGTVFRFEAPCAPGVMSIAQYAGVKVTGSIGCTYRIDYATNLANPFWIPLATNTLTATSFLYLDTSEISGSRFYRTVAQ